MPRNNRKRKCSGKVVTAGHNFAIEGLDKAVQQMCSWPEVSTIRMGAIRASKRGGRGCNRVGSSSHGDNGVSPKTVKRPKRGGGFTIKVRGHAKIGEIVTGIDCVASYGTTLQQVVLCGPDLDAVLQRLKDEGYEVKT